MSRLNDEQLENVIESLHAIEFGSIMLTIHEGQVTQIDTTEKKRFTANKTKNNKNRKIIK